MGFGLGFRFGLAGRGGPRQAILVVAAVEDCIVVTKVLSASPRASSADDCIVVTGVVVR